MHKEFVPYAESLELKELGFDEPTLYHWHSSCKTHPFTNEICNPNCRPKTNSGIKSIGEENHVWSAPTYSQAFRWFRETYDLMGLILPYLIIGNRWRYQITNRNNSSGLPFEEGFDTYEEAELACLRKLIEIVKNK